MINVTNLDRSQTMNNLQFPIKKFSGSGKQISALTMKINDQSIKPIEELQSSRYSRQMSRNYIETQEDEKQIKRQEEQENLEMMSELISDSSESIEQTELNLKSQQSENV